MTERTFVDFQPIGGAKRRIAGLTSLPAPRLTWAESEALKTGRPLETVRAEQLARTMAARAQTDAMLAEARSRDLAEFSEAVRAGIVAPTDPRIAGLRLADRPAPRSASLDTAPVSGRPDPARSGTDPQSSSTGSEGQVRSVFRRVASAILRVSSGDRTVAEARGVTSAPGGGVA